MMDCLEVSDNFKFALKALFLESLVSDGKQ